MMDEIWYWPYRLKARGPLNAVTRRREYEGVLLKSDEGGHACMHPWPELGDPTLVQCLEDLRGARRRSLVRRALRCMEMDAAARSMEYSLFDELEVPRSHATVPSWDRNEVARAVALGYDCVKLKAGEDLEGLGRFLEEMVAEYAFLKWRLDWNESGTAEGVLWWLGGLSRAVKSRLDFLEDPCPYQAEKWKKLRNEGGIKLAVDREAAPLTAEASFMVVKPAVDEPWLLGEAAVGRGQRLVVTSAMDHPVGQAFAAWEAGRLALQFRGSVDLCGLQTHGCFERDAFSECLGLGGPEFQAPEGHGLGFDLLLEKLPWKRLTS